MEEKNYKSDKAVKEEFAEELKKAGYNNIMQQPADIKAEKDGKEWFFEIKSTTKGENETVFGAATLTEWEQAIKEPETFRFVLAFLNSDGKKYSFKYYKPEDFLKYSSIPPFKINFNWRESNTPIKRRTSIEPTFDNIKELDDFYETFKQKNAK